MPMEASRSPTSHMASPPEVEAVEGVSAGRAAASDRVGPTRALGPLPAAPPEGTSANAASVRSAPVIVPAAKSVPAAATNAWAVSAAAAACVPATAAPAWAASFEASPAEAPPATVAPAEAVLAEVAAPK